MAEARAGACRSSPLLTAAAFAGAAAPLPGSAAAAPPHDAVAWPSLAAPRGDDGTALALETEPTCDEAGAPLAFLPMANAFELFGFDFLLEQRSDGVTVDGGSASETGAETASRRRRPSRSVFPVLLEVNAGPALEGVAWPMLCRRVVGDALDAVEAVLVGGGSVGGSGGGGGIEPPARFGEFERVL